MRRPAASSMGYPFPWRPWPVLRARTPLRPLSVSLPLRQEFPEIRVLWGSEFKVMDEALSLSELS